MYSVHSTVRHGLFIYSQGKPKPVVSWTKNGGALDTKRVNIRSTDRDSILFIRSAERDDSGVYEMSVKVEDFEDKAPLVLQIVGEQTGLLRVSSTAYRCLIHPHLFVELPGPPASVKIVDTWGFNVALEWTVPKDNGNTEITGYTVQKADKKTGVSLSRRMSFQSKIAFYYDAM